MRRSAALVMLVVILAGCGTAETPTPTVPAAEVTATFEAARELLRTAKAETRSGSAATATVQPTTPIVVETVVPTATAAAVVSTGGEPAGVLVTMLPRLERFPDDFVIYNEGRLSLDVTASGRSDPTEHAQRLRDWGFRRAAISWATLASAGPTDDSNRMTEVHTRIVEVDTPEHAAELLQFYFDTWISCQCGYQQPVAIDLIGDQTLAASGTVDSSIDTGPGFHAKVWVRIGTRVWEFTGMAVTHDTLPELNELARGTIGQEPDLLALSLPWIPNLPDGFVMMSDDNQPLDQVAGTMADPANAEQRLSAGGFVRARLREFGALFDRGTPLVYMTARVIEFGTPEQAAAEFGLIQQDIEAGAAGMQAVEADPMGDQTIAATYTATVGTDTAPAVGVTVRLGNRLYTYVGVSEGAPPIVETLDVARSSLTRVGD